MPVRVLMAAMPGMLHDIIQDALAEQPALQIVAKLEPGDDLDAAVERHEVDIVAMSAVPSKQNAISEQMLFDHPRVRLLMLSPDGRAASLCRLILHEVTINDVSPQELVAAIVASNHADC
jgi:chemotaxis response regulator CheB